MAKAILPTNFQDDILDSSMDGKRRYKQTTNADGTVSLEDASTYGQVGSNFGASQLNAISKAVNESADSSKIISDPDTASATTEQGYIADVQLFNHLTDSLQEQPTFVYDEDGKITGYKTKVGADTVFPFNTGNICYRLYFDNSIPGHVDIIQNNKIKSSSSFGYVENLIICDGYLKFHYTQPHGPASLTVLKECMINGSMQSAGTVMFSNILWSSLSGYAYLIVPIHD